MRKTIAKVAVIGVMTASSLGFGAVALAQQGSFWPSPGQHGFFFFGGDGFWSHLPGWGFFGDHHHHHHHHVGPPGKSVRPGDGDGDHDADDPD